MPGKVWIMNVAGFVLQYVFLILIYYFIYRIARIIIQDLRKANAASFSAGSASVEKSMEASARLTVIDPFPGHPVGKIISLGEATAIGRGEGNDIIIEDSFISHEHSCITYYKSKYWLADLRSTNYTYLNEQIVTEEVQLKSGDLIKVGRITFKFER